jgi:HK97 family phage major capsid protein
MYLGFPIRVTPKLPTSISSLTGQAMMLFGDLSLAAAVGNRRGVTVQTSDQRYLDTDQIAVRGRERLDIVVHDSGDNSKARPIVALVAP